MADGLKPQGGGGFDLSRLFADPSSRKQSPKPAKRGAGRARELAGALPQLAWDPLTLNERASSLHLPVTRCVSDDCSRNSSTGLSQSGCMRHVSLWLASRLFNDVRRPHEGGQHGEAEAQQPYIGWQHAGLRLGDFEVEFPMALRLCLGLTAQPDAQLQLFSVRAGSDAKHRPASGASRFPKADSEPPGDPPCLVLQFMTRGTQSGLSISCYTPRAKKPGLAAGVLVLAKNAATLAFLGLLFPDAATPWLRNMAVAGAVSSVFMAGRRSAASRGWNLRRPSLRVNLREDGALVKGALPARCWPLAHLLSRTQLWSLVLIAFW